MLRKIVSADRIRTASGVAGNAVLIEGGRVAAVGMLDELRRPDVAEERYPGAVIVPGLRDAHFHPVSYTALINGVNLKNAPDLAAVTATLRRAAETLSPGEPLVALRIDDETLAERRLPTRDDLDRIVRDRPVLVHRYCGHVAIANTAALAAAGIDEQTPDPDGGIIDREGGVPTGVLRETAITLVATALQRRGTVGTDDLVTALAGLAGLGITSIGAIAGCGDGPWASLGDETELLADAAVRLPIRLNVYVIAGSSSQLVEKAKHLEGRSPRLRWAGVKCFADGSFGGHTAAMLEPYADDPGETGTLRLRPIHEELARTALQLDGSVAIHAIGDRACGAVLDLFESLVASGAPPERLRLEHASVLTQDDVVRIGRLGVIASVQPAFMGSEAGWLEARVGRERLLRTYPFRTMERAGIVLAGGSDCPVEPPHPLWGMALARDRAGIVPEEGLSAEAALRMFTDAAAAALGEPEPLAIGSPADLTVLDVDPVECSPDQLRTATVLVTMVDGERIEVPERPVWPS